MATLHRNRIVYVANAGDSQSGNGGNISVINGATNVMTTLKDGKAVDPAAVAVNSVTNKIYVVNSGSDNVTVIDGGDESLSSTSPITFAEREKT